MGAVASLSRATQAADPAVALDAATKQYTDAVAIVARPGDDLNAKIAALLPGQTLVITGRHVVTDALVAVSGTSTLPITIRGDGTAVIEHTGGRTGTGYALTVTGAYLHFADLVAQEAAKAIVVQGTGAHDIAFERVVGRRVKNEAWKFRQGANLIHCWDCHAEDTGLGAAFGEGFYVGEASSNWLPTPGITPDTTSYVRFERCTTRRTLNDGFDFKEGSHHLVAKDCLVDKPLATIGDTQGDSGYYNRGDTVQYVNCHVRNAPGDGFKPYDVVVNAITYGRGVEVWGGLVEGAGGAGVASQSDDLKVYSNFAVAGTVVGGRTNVVGGGWTSAYDPATFVELTWSSPALLWHTDLPQHAPYHATGGQDAITPAMIGAQAKSEKDAANGYLGVDGSGNVPVAKLYGATTTTFGIVKLAGDLAGTSALPTVVRPVVTKTASYTATTADRVIVFDTTSGAMTCTLPAAATMVGQPLLIKKLGGATANPLTIDGNASETIDGALTEVISVAGGFREIISDGTKWHIIGGKVEPVIVQLAGITTAAAAINIDASVGSIYRVTASGSATTCTLAVPTNPIDGDMVTVELLASVATTLTVNASILTAGGAPPVVSIPIGKRWFGVLRYVTGVGWFLTGSAVQA